jgi:hypothetical protein
LPLRRNTGQGRSVVGYEIWEDLDHAQRRLGDAGYDVQRRSDIGPGTPDVLVLMSPAPACPCTS